MRVLGYSSKAWNRMAEVLEPHGWGVGTARHLSLRFLAFIPAKSQENRFSCNSCIFLNFQPWNDGTSEKFFPLNWRQRSHQDQLFYKTSGHVCVNGVGWFCYVRAIFVYFFRNLQGFLFVAISGFIFHRFLDNTNKWIWRILEFRKIFLSLGKKFLEFRRQILKFFWSNSQFLL